MVRPPSDFESVKPSLVCWMSMPSFCGTLCSRGRTFVAKLKVRPPLHSVPQKLGIDIQQTSEGFTLSKSEGGRTIYTIRASNAVQFKKGGHADLKNVNIIVYGRAHDRFDQIYGKEF